MAVCEKDSFTFVTLTYNHSGYIIEHLESIKYQIEKNGEDYNVSLVLADDHSHDNTIELVRRWVARNVGLFAKVSIFASDRNSGTCVNYVKALEAVDAQWFKVLAGDDVYAISDIFSLVRETERYSFVSGVPLILEGPALHFSKTLTLNMIATDAIYQNHFGDAMRNFSSIHTPSLAYGRTLVDDERIKEFIKNYILVEDFAMQIKACEVNPNISYKLIPEVYVYYRRTNNSAYIIKNDKFLDDKRRLYKYLASKESSIIKKVLLHNRIFCLGLINKALKMLFNLNAYVYFCLVAINVLKILRKYNSVNVDIEMHKVHYQKIKDAAACFLNEAIQDCSATLASVR
ncbi:MAG: hypothetical protein A2087_06660 [Spirochaetes bacterium GWD1_61_31]|nr:MAG: hypothetical protein A2Y37_08810 [Spirochaetes bacterium GWB1_60_80]OHD31872.1 MAG: hypothetical protein A2004_10195 [Spirochaetes bacterium GWC1_61_12]OHD40031.1 MAG: hypothetical protein A2087_06660 [Spirochaetes bacterium GWD1_61_31]OHD42315.1 MAG: hypothetical protein A2Y35_11340 [Spirochaetes bacterium GWE1_60_18]OHD58464.1 MAG: hypothetical protein A2Y32_06840 [Spirochaetes bacterium GWF1_60_12]HAW85453.1 hypothetical protein [Spirochaetaceae bacterium]